MLNFVPKSKIKRKISFLTFSKIDIHQYEDSNMDEINLITYGIHIIKYKGHTISTIFVI